MKPGPRQRHLPAIAILAVVAVVQTLLACLDNRLSPEQVRMLTARVKRHASDRDLLREDPTFGDRGIWPKDGPLDSPFRRFLAEVMTTDTSALRPHVALGASAGVLALAYMCGMYVLLVRQCRVWSLAVFVAVCSLRIVDTLGNAYWGVGALASATGEGFFIAAAPWLVFAFLRTADRRQMILVVAAAGLLGNAYVPGAVGLTTVLLVAYLFARRLTWRRAALVGLCLAAVTVTLAPAWVHHVRLVQSLPADDLTTGPRQAAEALGTGSLRVGYVPMLKNLLNLTLQVSVLILAMVFTFVHAVRRRVRDQGFWLWSLGTALVLAVPVHSVCLLAGALRSGPPPAINFIRASSLALLPLYVFLAEALVALFRMLPSSRRLLRALCALLVVAWFAGSDNVRIARHAFLEAATMFLDEENRPANVRRHREEDLARSELTAMALWARETKNTDRSSVFAIDPADGAVFRMISHRSVTAARDDVRAIYYLAPQRLGRWHQRVLDQGPMLAGKTVDADVKGILDTWTDKAGLFRNATAWYVVRRADEPVPKGLVEISGKAGGWGKVYRLFKLPR